MTEGWGQPGLTIASENGDSKAPREGFCQDLLLSGPEQFQSALRFPLLAPSSKSNGILITDFGKASYLLSTHFFVYLNSQTLVFPVLPGTIGFYFLSLVATYQGVSTHLVKIAGLEDQVSGGNFLAWSSCLARKYKYLPIATFRSYLRLFTAVVHQNVTPKSDTLYVVLQKSQCPLVYTSLPQTQTVTECVSHHTLPEPYSAQVSGEPVRPVLPTVHPGKIFRLREGTQTCRQLDGCSL